MGRMPTLMIPEDYECQAVTNRIAELSISLKKKSTGPVLPLFPLEGTVGCFLLRRYLLECSKVSQQGKETLAVSLGDA